MNWFAQAPSNIALIKYMGKEDEEKNIPMNSSLSFTLNQLLSSVSLESHAYRNDLWEPLNIPGDKPFSLSVPAQSRYLLHLQRLKEHFNYTGGFIVRSSNNFPKSSGLASSASSFAALTKCAALALSELTNKPLPSATELSILSRQGSGSSCRSFFSPWALWEGEGAHAIDLPYKTLFHQAIIISHDEKDVSSKEAHQKIHTSSLFPARQRQASEHLKLLLAALDASDWKSCYEICWREFQNMHALFATCDSPFSYITPRSQEVLQLLQELWERENDGPIVTMDAGPNIHLLYRPDQTLLAQTFKQHHLIGNYDVI
jgi:diphosphomevalonate decarboxylase